MERLLAEVLAAAAGEGRPGEAPPAGTLTTRG